MGKNFDDLLTYFAHEGDVVSHTAPLSADAARSLGIPDRWLAALTGPKKITDQIRALWEPLERWMPRTRAMYAKHCVALAIVHTRQNPLSLLYCFDIGKSWTAQRGFLPNSVLPGEAHRIPVNLSPLYDLHDGLVNFASQDDGPLPIAKWRVIPDPPRGGGLLEFFTEGGRGLGFDIGTDPVRAYWLDADDYDNPVEEVEKVWDFMDGHMARWLERRK